MQHLLLFTACVAAAMVMGAIVLHLIPKLGSVGRRVSDWLCRAPALDWVITYFTIAPLIVGPALYGGWGVFAALVGQIGGMLIWQFAHEWIHRDAVKGPRIIKVMNQKHGALRNYTACWVTALATPVFWVIRLAEFIVYTPLPWLVGLPKYRSQDWVNVSRQKFQGLVGHDLIWCLYCDWMTGVWSLATEMLRNVESFWCPIRFRSDKKCENCKIDFPDVANGWVDSGGTMADVVAALEEQYPPSLKVNAWFGHPVRVTVKGKEIESTETIAAK